MSEHPPQPKETPDPADKFEDIRDLIDVGEDMNGDGVNTLHRPDGKLLAVDELEMIREHQDLIRGTIDDRGENEDLPNDTDREKNRSMDADRDHIIAEHIHRLTNGKGASPETVDKLYEMLKQGKKIDDIELPIDEPPENSDGEPGNPNEPNDPENPDDTPTLVMQAPQVESRFTPEQLQKQREILDAIDDADRIFDRNKRMRALKELAEKYKDIDFTGDTGTLGVEAAQRIRVSKTRSKWNPRRLWVKNTKKSNYQLSQMAYEKDEKYSLHAAKAMGGNLHIMNKLTYPGRNETIHRTNKWYETKVVKGLEDRMDTMIAQADQLNEQIIQKQQEIQADANNEELKEELRGLQLSRDRLDDTLQRTYHDYEQRRFDTLDALGTLRGFGGNEYFGKGIAYLAITKNEPELLYALEGLDRINLRFREQPVAIPLLGKVRELYHKIRITKAADAMMIPQILRESIEDLSDQRNQGIVDDDQFEQISRQLVQEARAAAQNIKQPDWRDDVIVQINKQTQ